MRQVTAKYWDSDQKQWAIFEGQFHQWAAKYEEFSGGPGNYTVALVEDSTGQIRESLPEDVRFIS
jgi:hypothetical protein